MAALNISNLDNHVTQKVQGVVRVHRPARKIANNHSEYLAMDLSNITGSISAFAWDNKYHSSYIPKENDIICIHGRTKILPISKAVAIDLYEIVPVAKVADNPIAFMQLPPESDQEYVKQLVAIMDGLGIKQLREFVYQVFSNEKIVRQFVMAKGSGSYHHNEVGGLLKHSVVMANYVRGHRAMVPAYHLEIGIIAALLHDIVKIKDWYNRQKSEIRAPIVKHDSRILEMVAGPLDVLEESWQDGADLMRTCLEYPVVKKDFMYKRLHVPTIVNIVRSADENSASLYKERVVATKKKPNQKISNMFGEIFYDYDPPPNYQN